MKTIGIIGGMSWESSLQYYRLLNEQAKERLGGLHSAKCLLYNVDFKEIEHLQSEGNWDKLGRVIGDVAKTLESAGVDFILIASNTAHKVFSAVQNEIHIPILHIADATAAAVHSKGIKTVGLLGTRYTMEQDFYKSRIMLHGLHVVVPKSDERERINTIIFEELCLGHSEQTSKNYLKKIIDDLTNKGAQGIILGCTELGLLIQQKDSNLELFDTVSIHVSEAVKQAIESN